MWLFFSNKKLYPLVENHELNMKHFILSKVYIDEGSIRKFYSGLSTYMGDNPLAKTCGLSPFTGIQCTVELQWLEH